MELKLGPRAVRAITLTLSIALIASLFPAKIQADPRLFTARFSTNDTGDIAIVANTLVTCSQTAAAQNCAAAQGGTETGADLNNNNYTMVYVDADSDGSTFNSSGATFNLPAGATVLFAGLYWGADSTAGVASAGLGLPAGAPPPNASLWNQVKFATPASGGYVDIAASVPIDFIASGGSAGTDYQGFADVTSLVQAGGSGQYMVGNVQAGTGADRQAGWALVVAFRDASLPARNLTVFDGLQIVNATNASIDIPVSGFQTPPTGPVITSVGVVAYEGDRGSTGDNLRLDGTILTDANNPSGNFFNSTVSSHGTTFTAKGPNYLNQLGFDADIVQANGVLANGATSATINLTTASPGGETYLPGVVTFVTDLYAPSISAPKSVVDINGGQLAPGDILEYTIVVTNTGQDAANTVIATDPIPTHTTYVPGSLVIDNVPQTDATGDDTAYFDTPNNRAVYHIGTGATAAAGGTLAENGGTTTLKLRVQVNADVPNGTTISNQAQTSYTGATTGTAFSTSGTASTATISQLTADLTLTKTSTPIPYVPGEPFSYTIVATNIGPDAAPGATIDDTLPAALEGFTWTCTGSGGAACGTSGGTLGPAPAINMLADLPSGGSVTIVVTGILPPSTSGGLTNTATITPPASVLDPAQNNNTGTDVNPGGPKADLRISKASTPNAFVPGDTLTYTLIVSNAGPSDAVGARVRDQLDAALAGFTWTCSAGSGATCQTASGTGDIDALVDLPVGTMASFTITGVVPASYTAAATNTATIDPPANVTDPVQGNNVARSQNPPGPIADLSITKTQTPDPYTAGSPLTYTLLVQNHGPSDVSNARVQDIPPGELSNVTWTCAASGAGALCGIDNGVNVIDALVTLPAGTTATFTMIGMVAPGATGVVTNTATVKEPAGVTDPVPGSNESSVPSGPAPVADLSAVKTASINPYVPGLPLSFTIVVSNAGPSDALNARVQDLFPTALSGFTWTCAPSSGAATCGLDGGTSLIDTFVTLPVGTAVTFTVSGVVPANTTGPLTNSVTVAPPQGVRDPDTSSNLSAVTLGPGPQADLRLTKTSTPNPYVPGAPITYTIVAANDGPSTVFGARVRDGLPATLQNVTWTCAATNGTCPAPSGTGNVDALVNIGPGGTVTFTITADVPGGTRGTLVNAATILPPPGIEDPIPNNNSGVDYNPSIPIPGPSDLKITQEFPSVAPPNGLLTFRLVTRNMGSSAALNPYITGLIPPGTIFVSATPSAGGTCNVPGNPPAPDPVTGYPASGTATEPLRCTWPGLMNVGESHVLEFTVRVAPGTSTGQILWSCWWTWSETEDPFHANNVVDAYLFVDDGASSVGDLAIQAAALTDGAMNTALAARVGDPVPMRFWVTNNGPAAARGQYALILDTATTVEIVDIQSSQGWVAPSGPSSGVWDTGMVEPGQTVALDLTVRVLTPGAMELFAQRVAGIPGDPNASNERAAIVLDGYGPGAAGRWVAVGNVDGAGAGEIVTGAGQGETPQVRVFAGTGADTGVRFYAYERPFSGGVHVASCDVNGDGIAEVITAPGPGRASTIRVLSLVGGVVTELMAFDAFEASFTGGASIACADLDGDGSAELTVGAGPGRAPEVQVYNVGPSSITLRATFLAYETGFLGGVRVTAGVYAGRPGWLDAFAIATTPGAGRPAELRLWTELGAPVAQIVISSATTGVLPTLGDIDGDGLIDLLVAPDDGRPELVRIFNVDSGELLGEVAGGLPEFPVGVRTAIGVLEGGPGAPEIVVGNGPGGHPLVRVVFWPSSGPVLRLEILPLEVP